MLDEYNLKINETKTEEYDVKKGGNEEWRKCKFLGSLLGTVEDINRRKILTIDCFNTMKDIFNSRKVSQDLKFRIFQAYIEPIFLFNSELWTLNKTQEKKIDAFQRKLYSRVLNIYWPKIITNVKVYEKAKSDKWSRKIRQIRLKWFGHMARLPEDTPA